MAYDMMREALKELLAGNTTPEEMQDNIESISHIFLVSKAALNERELTIKMSHSEDSSKKFTLGVTITVLEGEDALNEMRHQAETESDEETLDQIKDIGQKGVGNTQLKEIKEIKESKEKNNRLDFS